MASYVLGAKIDSIVPDSRTGFTIPECHLALCIYMVYLARLFCRQSSHSRRPTRALACVRPFWGTTCYVSDKELVKRGYPIRPNPEQAPGAFNTWRRAVSIPTTVIDPRQVARQNVRIFSQESSRYNVHVA